MTGVQACALQIYDISPGSRHDDPDLARPASGLGEFLRSLLAGIPWSDRAECEETFRLDAPPGGSIKIYNANGKTRVIGEDRDEPDTRLMLPVKMNLAKAAPGLRFTITAPGIFEWLGTTDANSVDVFAPANHPDEAGPKVREAMDWLEKALAKGPVLAKTLKQQARNNCISERTLDRAKAMLGVESFLVDGKIGGDWHWRLPTKPVPRDTG